VRVMDSTAITLCRENDLPIVVVDLWSPGSIRAAALGQPVGTLVDGEEGGAARQYLASRAGNERRGL
jgi:hypothetical protein